MTLTEPDAGVPAPRYQIIEENIRILEEEDVEFISVPIPEFADSDPADIVHDFQRVRGSGCNQSKSFVSLPCSFENRVCISKWHATVTEGREQTSCTTQSCAGSSAGRVGFCMWAESERSANGTDPRH